MDFRLDVSHAALPHLAGSFAVAKSGNGGNARGTGAGDHGGGGNGRGGSDQGSAGNHGGGNSHGNGGAPDRSGHGPSGRKADRDTSPGVSDVSPKRIGSAHLRAAPRLPVLQGPAQGQHPAPLYGEML